MPMPTQIPGSQQTSVGLHAAPVRLQLPEEQEPRRQLGRSSQLLPSVTRAHISLSLPSVALHMPPPHVYTAAVRERVPVWSQTSEKPPQGPHGPYIVMPQLTPVVVREQPSESVPGTIAHALLIHVNSV